MFFVAVLLSPSVAGVDLAYGFSLHPHLRLFAGPELEE
jgi:hypothetical protein